MTGADTTSIWIQFQIQVAPLRPRGGSRPEPGSAFDAGAHAAFLGFTQRLAARVLKALAPLRRSGMVHAAFFQRKPPGVRWRIACADAAVVRAVLVPELDAFCRPGWGFSGWIESVYEPELALFGGALALEVVHRLFDADTAAWSRLVALRRRRLLAHQEALLVLAKTNELFASALPQAPEEVWDAWSRLAQFHSVATPRDPGDRSRPSMTWLAERAGAGPVRDALASVANAQARAGRDIAALQRVGDLSQGLRGVLAAMALFSWNRVGLTLQDRRLVLGQALRAWHPYVAPQPALLPVAA